MMAKSHDRILCIIYIPHTIDTLVKLKSEKWEVAHQWNHPWHSMKTGAVCGELCNGAPINFVFQSTTPTSDSCRAHAVTPSETRKSRRRQRIEESELDPRTKKTGLPKPRLGLFDIQSRALGRIQAVTLARLSSAHGLKPSCAQHCSLGFHGHKNT